MTKPSVPSNGWFDDTKVHATTRCGLGLNPIEFSPDDRQVSYPIKGDLGEWCQDLLVDLRYDFLTAEFGTYSAVAILQALRAEQRAHWHSLVETIDDRPTARLIEVFAPAQLAWRDRCVAQGLNICQQALMP